MNDAAAGAGKWARAHTVFQRDDEDLEGAGGSTFVIDVFDAPIPLDDEDEDTGMCSARSA